LIKTAPKSLSSYSLNLLTLKELVEDHLKGPLEGESRQPKRRRQNTGEDVNLIRRDG
jgi:hypothetical protein